MPAVTLSLVDPILPYKGKIPDYIFEPPSCATNFTESLTIKNKTALNVPVYEVTTFFPTPSQNLSINFDTIARNITI